MVAVCQAVCKGSKKSYRARHRVMHAERDIVIAFLFVCVSVYLSLCPMPVLYLSEVKYCRNY